MFNLIYFAYKKHGLVGLVQLLIFLDTSGLNTGEPRAHVEGLQY
jgi:hypothetical protein